MGPILHLKASPSLLLNIFLIHSNCLQTLIIRTIHVESVQLVVYFKTFCLFAAALVFIGFSNAKYRKEINPKLSTNCQIHDDMQCKTNFIDYAPYINPVFSYIPRWIQKEHHE